MKEDYSQGTNPPGENAIDFPCSYAWRSYYQEILYGEYLPSIELPKEAKTIPIKEKPTNQNELAQLKAQMLYIQNKINEHIDEGKKRKKAGTY